MPDESTDPAPPGWTDFFDEEYAAYGAILRTAEAGQWKEAEQAAIRFRRDQLR